MNRTDALNILGLCDPAYDPDIKSAFRARIKGVHPDLNPTSDALLRLMIEARDTLLDTSPPDRRAMPDSHVVSLTITPHQAINGGTVVCEVPVNFDIIEHDKTIQSLNHMRQIRISLPKGLRSGEILTAKNGGLRPERSEPSGFRFCIDIAIEESMTIAGNDIWIQANVDSEILRHGGTTLIDTPHGPKSLTIKGPFSNGSSLCLSGFGLPERAGFAVGDLHIRLIAREAPAQPAAVMLNRFTQRWG